MIRILLVDDHDLVRIGIRRLLEDVADFSIIAEASSGEEAVKLSREHTPDVVLMDINMPGIGGLEASKQIMHFSHDSKIIALSATQENPIPAKFMQMGAFGYLTKGASASEMTQAIRKVHAGIKYYTPDVAMQIALDKTAGTETSPFALLSDRELQIVTMLTKGDKVPSIASRLNISAKTVNTHKYRALDKLGVDNDVALTHLAIQHKLIEPGMA